MNKTKSTLLSGSVLILALIAALSIVYAAYSQNLTINGTANVKAVTWDVHLENLTVKTIKGEAEENKQPTISEDGLTIQNIDVTLSKPGDSVQYYFEVVNDGDFNAKLGQVVKMTPICTGTGDNAEQDAQNVCKAIEFLIWSDMNNRSVDPSTKEWYINQKEREKYVIYINYLANRPVDELAKNPVKITGMQATLVYTQVD